MMKVTNKQTKMDILLDSMAEELQLDDTRRERMTTAYESVKDWIEDDDKFFKPYKYDVYPHGSVRILTTVKPIQKDEFDLDIAIHLKMEGRPHNPEKIYNELKRRLQEHGTYKNMVELKNRCIRLNYAGDFHMDILPGIQENPFDDNKLIVPDRDLGIWVSSNPRGYSDWFMGRNDLVMESLLIKALNAEKLPTDNFKNKKPLQRAVQLIKRYRDIYFQSDSTYKTSSIVLTTLAGEFYSGQESIFDAVDKIINSIRNKVATNPTRFKILNPVNSQEDFTDKWEKEPTYYAKFKDFCEHLYSEWQNLKGENGIKEESLIFKGLFGESIYNMAVARQNNFFGKIPNNVEDEYAGLRKLAQPATVTQKPWSR